MKELHLTTPKSWSELTQEQLTSALMTIVDINTIYVDVYAKEDYTAHTTAYVAVRCLLQWNGVKVITPYGSNWLVSVNGTEEIVSEAQIASASRALDFLGEAPDAPVYIHEVDGRNAVGGDFGDEFSFDSWLSCEILWQAYQTTSDNSLLCKMAQILYDKDDIKLCPHEVLSIFYWYAGLKNYCSKQFPNFFSPAQPGTDNGPTPQCVQQSMNAQIRALTKGDITKEALILSLPAHRALTELDALAREYEELNRKYPTT